MEMKRWRWKEQVGFGDVDADASFSIEYDAAGNIQLFASNNYKKGEVCMKIPAARRETENQQRRCISTTARSPTNNCSYGWRTQETEVQESMRGVRREFSCPSVFR
eukprot:755358-Hanusia_phi.AAC.1